MDAATSAQPMAPATQDIDTLRLAKEALDIQLLPELEDAVLKCSAKIDHLLGSLQSSLHAVCTARARGLCSVFVDVAALPTDDANLAQAL